jgi:O-succinylbenzoate synthase
MRIDRVRLLTLSLPLRFPFETSFGRWVTRETIVVVAESSGLSGFGEVTAHELPVYSYETLRTAHDVLSSHLVPACLARAISSPEDAVDAMAFVRGHPMAKAGLEGAIRDLLARASGASLSTALGGTRHHVRAGVSLGIEASPEALVERARPFVEARYERVKVKIRPGWDVAPVRAMRAAFPDLSLAADANAAYRLADAGVLAALAEHRLAYVEQPLAWDDLVDHATLARGLAVPVCIDESLTGVAAARAALALGAAGVFNIKIGRVGGLAEALRIHDVARSAGIPVWCGGMLETCIGRLHNLALASLPGFTLTGDLSGTDRYFHVDVVDPPIRVDAEGRLAIPDGPGIGRSVDMDALAAHTVEETSIGGGARATRGR